MKFIYGLNRLTDEKIQYDRYASCHGAIFGNRNDRSDFAQREMLKVLANSDDQIYLLTGDDTLCLALSDVISSTVIHCDSDSDFTSLPDTRMLVFQMHNNPVAFDEVYQKILKRLQKHIAEKNNIHHWIYIDYPERFIQDKNTMELVHDMFYGTCPADAEHQDHQCILTFLSDNFQQVISSKQFRDMLSSIEFHVLFPQDNSTADIMKSFYMLSDHVQYLHEDSHRQGLILQGSYSTPIPFKII